MKPLLLRRTLYLLACASLAACNGRSGHAFIPLKAASIYNADSVRLAMDGGDARAAAMKMQEALDLYKKSKDTLGSIPVFKNSILLKPTARAYFELSGPLLATRRYDEAIEALAIAEKLGYAPLANVMFRYSYAYGCKMSDARDEDNGKYAVHYMQLALQMGYAHPEEYLRKEYFPKLLAYEEFTSVFNDAVSGMAGRNPEKSLWDSYAVQFPEVGLPFMVNMDWIKAHPLGDAISFEFEKFIPEMRSARFEREGGDVYYYVALVKKDPAYLAVVYGSQYEGAEGPPELDSANIASGAASTLTPLFYLVTYDPHGKLIDKMVVAGRSDLTQPFKAFAVQGNMHFQVQDFNDAYKDSSDTAPRDSSNYIGLKAQTPQNYLIDAAGKFLQTDLPLAAR